MSRKELEMFVIYENPSDYPDRFVVRRWEGLMAERVPLAVCSTLEGARTAIPPGRYNLGRYSADDPAICEVWL